MGSQSPRLLVIRENLALLTLIIDSWLPSLRQALRLPHQPLVHVPSDNSDKTTALTPHVAIIALATLNIGVWTCDAKFLIVLVAAVLGMLFGGIGRLGVGSEDVVMGYDPARIAASESVDRLPDVRKDESVDG